MRNLVNWMCLISVIFLILQVMMHISSEAIADVNNSIYKEKRRKNKSEHIGNRGIEKKVIKNIKKF